MHDSPDAVGTMRLMVTELLRDRAIHPIDAAALAWDQPMLLLRSAHMERLQQFLNVMRTRARGGALHVMSHARDEGAIRAMTGAGTVFHPYHTPGRYSLDKVPAATIEQLRSVGFGTLVLLDAGQDAEGLEGAEQLLTSIDASRVATFRADGTFGRPADWALRHLASEAFYRLNEWYLRKADPACE